MNVKEAENHSNTLGIILVFFVLLVFIFGQSIKYLYQISDSEYSSFFNHYKFMILFVLLIAMLTICFLYLIFNIGKVSKKPIKHTEITGRSIEVFENVNAEELDKYILILPYSGKVVDKTKQEWGHTFKVTSYKQLGKHSLYVGSGWSVPIFAGDFVHFNGVKYLVLASVHTTEYSITQIYKVLLVKEESQGLTTSADLTRN